MKLDYKTSLWGIGLILIAVFIYISFQKLVTYFGENNLMYIYLGIAIVIISYILGINPISKVLGGLGGR